MSGNIGANPMGDVNIHHVFHRGEYFTPDGFQNIPGITGN
ncbi:hypothetical protein SF148580_3047 [Shigella flexneri 1485-80]|nr:hypothetical protein SF148580_3047 [Shigella flexneri 1485-80]